MNALTGEPQHKPSRLQHIPVGRVDLDADGEVGVFHQLLNVEIGGKGADRVVAPAGGRLRLPAEENLVQGQINRRRGPELFLGDRIDSD